MSEYVELISTVGFPIICCIMLMKNNMETMDFFKTNSNKMNESLDNNTKVLTELVILIKRGLDIENHKE